MVPDAPHHNLWWIPRILLSRVIDPHTCGDTLVICVDEVEVTDFVLCCVLCKGLGLILVCWGASLGEGNARATVGMLETMVPHLPLAQATPCLSTGIQSDRHFWQIL